MFGMGFIEIMLILIVAVIALGPEKLPSAAVDIAKMIKKLKSSVDDVKLSVNSELDLAGIKDEAEKFKDSMGVDRLANLNLDNILNDDDDVNIKQKKDKKRKKKSSIVKNEDIIDKNNNKKEKKA